jgi:glycosyltransferase involved in cell wall biosynthesis
MKILILMDNNSGVSFHRLFTPYAKMQQDYDMVVDVSQTPTDWINIDYTQYDAVVFNRWCGIYQYNVFEAILKAKCKLVCDIDDYWVIPRSNPAFKFYKKVIKNCVKDAMALADIVTCSTDHLASKVKEFNKNTITFPNALDLTGEQWNLPKQKGDKLRVGWVGGISHLEDLKCVGDAVKRFCEDYDAEFYMCGYHSDSTEWHSCEKTITGVGLDKRPEWFKTVLGTRADLYGQSYALFDFCIAPLREDNFNQYKSELKIVEAAAYQLPIICSYVKPYSFHLYNPGVMLCNNTFESWYQCLKSMVNPIEMRGQANTDYCNKYHNLKTINEQRYQMLLELCS